jgi:hypothetical protein
MDERKEKHKGFSHSELVEAKLRRLALEFEKNNDPVIALEAFELARREGFKPPEWTLDFLSKGIHEYLKEEKETLDLALGLRKRGRSGRQPHHADKRKRHYRDKDLLFYIAILEIAFGLKVEEAVEIAYEKVGSHLMLSRRTIKDLYGKRGEEGRHDLIRLISCLDYPDCPLECNRCRRLFGKWPELFPAIILEDQQNYPNIRKLLN